MPRFLDGRFGTRNRESPKLHYQLVGSQLFMQKNAPFEGTGDVKFFWSYKCHRSMTRLLSNVLMIHRFKTSPFSTQLLTTIFCSPAAQLEQTPRRLLVEFADDPRYLLMSKDVGFGSKWLYSRCYRFSQKNDPLTGTTWYNLKSPWLFCRSDV